MDRQLERTVDEVRYGVDALVAEIERLELEVSELQNLLEQKEVRIESLEEYITKLGKMLDL